MENVKIKCPWCSSVLSVKLVPGIENKSVNCPVCKHKSPFVEFEKVVAAPPKPATPPARPSGAVNPGGERTIYGGATPANGHATTVLPDAGSANACVGRLEIPSTGEVFPLRPGRNVIGRRASQSGANIQISTSQKMISREHFVIDMQSTASMGNAYIVSLAKEQVNPTFVGTNRLEFKDAVLLNNGDIIRLPGDVVVRFVIS